METLKYFSEAQIADNYRLHYDYGGTSSRLYFHQAKHTQISSYSIACLFLQPPMGYMKAINDIRSPDCIPTTSSPAV